MFDLDSIFNWHRFSELITTSGQPREDGLAAIYDLGVRHIVNLGLHDHKFALPDEAEKVAALGMDYIHIPVDFAAPTNQDFVRFCAVVERLKGQPIHVHCIANYRVTAFLYLYRRDRLGDDEAAARAEMESIWQPTGVWVEFTANRR
ncbi:MAG: protein tyrosine phosphatase family protein [Sphingorhabdus sp.]